MSKKILVATEKPFAPEAKEKMIDILSSKDDYQIEILEKYSDIQQFKEAVKDADALIIRSDKASKEVIDAADKLKVIVRAGAGYDNIDLNAAKEKGICAMNTPGQNSNAVAELAIGMMVFMCRNKFNGKAGTELLGKKLGIHAYGNVGKAVARIAKGFGMKVYAYDPFVSADHMKAGAIEVVNSVEELYSTCQFISLHIPANDKTKNSINFELLQKMPKGAMLINTARKEVVCEEGLKKLLAQRPDFRYVSDVAPTNAQELQNEFADQVFFTPKKMGAQTAEANINAGVAAENQIIAFFEKGDTTFQVNK